MTDLINPGALRVVDGHAVTSSRVVADVFSKQHHHVVRAIRDLIAQKPDLARNANFGECSETVTVGNGATRKVTFYWMDRKGFAILAMGFTGAKALDFKCAFYDEFERMEEALRSKLPAADTIDAAQQLAIRNAVAHRAKTTSAHYRTIYNALYDAFQVPRYTELKAADFDDAIRFIEAYALPQLAAPAERRIVLTESEAQHFLSVAYQLKYLFREPYKKFFAFLNAVNSPMSGTFWDAFNDMSVELMASALERNGLRIEDLDCYRYWAMKH